MTHDTDHDFQQFRGKFDSAMVPDAAFKAKMEKLLNAEHQHVAAERVSSLIASPSTTGSGTVVPTRRNHPLMVAAAVLMVFAVVASSIWVLSGNVLEGEYANAPSGIATLPPDATGTPGPDVQLMTVPIDGLADVGSLLGIYDGVAIYYARQPAPQGLVRETSQPALTAEPFARENSLIAADINTGQRLWNLDNVAVYSVSHSGETLVLIQGDYGRFGEVQNREITGINLRSGEVLWETAVADSSHGVANQTGQISLVTEELVVIPDSDGVIRAWNPDSGQLIWENSFDPGKGNEVEWVTGSSQTETMRLVNLAGTLWDDYIVIVNDNGALQVISPTTGETISTQDVMRKNTQNQQLFSIPAGVVLFTQTSDQNGQRTEVSLINPLSGEVAWTTVFAGGAGSPSQAMDGSLVINSSEWHQNSMFLRLLGQSGYSTNQFYWIDGSTGQELLHTERERQARFPLYNFAVTNGDYACIRTEKTEVVCFDRTGTRFVFEADLVGDMMFVEDRLYVTTEDGLATVTLP